MLVQLGGEGADRVEVQGELGDDHRVVQRTAQILLTHRALRANAFDVATHLLELSPDDLVLSCIPMLAPYGQTCGLNAPVVAGACLTLVRRFEVATVTDMIRNGRVTVFVGSRRCAPRCSPPTRAPTRRTCAGACRRSGRSASGTA